MACDYTMNIFTRCCFIILTGIAFQADAGINEHMEKIRANPKALYAFLKAMPKGGELHYHFTGSIYAEAMLAEAAQGHYCLEPKTFVLQSFDDVCNGVNAKDIAKNPVLFNQVVEAWSMKNFIPGRESGYDHFFDSFAKFGSVAFDYYPQSLAYIMERASNQHELYLEIITFDLSNDDVFAKLIRSTTNLNQKMHILLANPAFQANINQSVSSSEDFIRAAHHELGCDSKPNKAACQPTIKFQYFVKREEPLDSVFAQALAGFSAASKSNNIVGINLVQAEDGAISLRDYHAQMQIFKFLHAVFPKVHISLHAGELNPQMVLPKDLRFHIQDAIFTGKAERIGHGVDIAHEDNTLNLLDSMAKKRIPVEINLTSNRVILNIAGIQHPLNDYIKHHIPVVLSTDDEGILRTDLTSQYVEAVLNHHLDYPTIKMINRNSLTYSFLPGKSIWVDPVKQIIVPACQDLASSHCKQYISGNQKALLQVELERKLSTFEHRF